MIKMSLFYKGILEFLQFFSERFMFVNYTYALVLLSLRIIPLLNVFDDLTLL